MQQLRVGRIEKYRCARCDLLLVNLRHDRQRNLRDRRSRRVNRHLRSLLENLPRSHLVSLH